MKLEDIKARCCHCDECDTDWLWNGHPGPAGHKIAIYVNKRRYPVRRTVFELHAGRAVRKGYCVVTDCANEKCMNPLLLREVTKKGVVKRQIAQGKILNAAHKAKLQVARKPREHELGPEKAMEIYLADGDIKDIAAKAGVSRQAVGYIKNQKTYRHIHNNPFQGLMR